MLKIHYDKSNQSKYVVHAREVHLVLKMRRPNEWIELGVWFAQRKQGEEEAAGEGWEIEKEGIQVLPAPLFLFSELSYSLLTNQLFISYSVLPTQLFLFSLLCDSYRISVISVVHTQLFCCDNSVIVFYVPQLFLSGSQLFLFWALSCSKLFLFWPYGDRNQRDSSQDCGAGGVRTHRNRKQAVLGQKILLWAVFYMELNILWIHIDKH